MSAVEFEMKENFNQGETLIAKISGNFLTTITNENVFFYRGHVRMPVTYNVEKINEDYYVYALLSDKSPANCSIIIDNIRYMKGSQISEEKITKNFSITDKTADFSVNPGFIVVSSENFSLEIQNLQDKLLEIKIKTPINISEGREIFISENLKELSVPLKSGEIKTISFKLGIGKPSLQKIELKTSNLTYEIPISILSSLEGTQKEFFKLEPSDLTLSFPINTTIKRTIFLYNTGSKELKNISLSLSDSLKSFINISQNKIEKLGANSNTPLELSIYSSSESEIEGKLKAISGEILAYSSISINFIKNYTPINQTTQSNTTKTCAELNGKICDDKTEKCDKQIIYAKDNKCCLGICKKIEKSSTGRIIAILLILAIIGGLVWFYFAKYKKTKKPVDLLKIAGGKK